MTFEDWIFSIHLLFAATLVGSLVMSWIVVVSMRTADTPAATLSLYRVAMVATGATIVGLIGAIAFGIWLAILRIEFHPWDGWVIGAIVLWSVARSRCCVPLSNTRNQSKRREPSLRPARPARARNSLR